jgi:hypothetical protein
MAPIIELTSLDVLPQLKARNIVVLKYTSTCRHCVDFMNKSGDNPVAGAWLDIIQQVEREQLDVVLVQCRDSFSRPSESNAHLLVGLGMQPDGPVPRLYFRAAGNQSEAVVFAQPRSLANVMAWIHDMLQQRPSAGAGATYASSASNYGRVSASNIQSQLLKSKFCFIDTNGNMSNSELYQLALTMPNHIKRHGAEMKCNKLDQLALELQSDDQPAILLRGDLAAEWVKMQARKR